MENSLLIGAVSVASPSVTRECAIRAQTRSEGSMFSRTRPQQPQEFTATHSIRCPSPGCGVHVSETRTSRTSQSDADNKAESAAWSAFNSADHNHN